MSLYLYNTLTRKKELFEPLRPGKVSMYNCGPTVYSYAHIGNFASFLMADLLRRYLEYSGYEVEQIMNITDVGHLTEDDVADAQGEDKLEKKAREEKTDPWAIARKYEDAFHEDRKALNMLAAARYPRATEHIPQMIAMIEELLELDLAYPAGDQIYFEIGKFAQYGVLSGNTTDELMAGHRVEADPDKRNPLDFTLWKKDEKHLMQWDSPWGRGFPGWHIECSAMSREYLGEVMDIHTGGEDNVFPHHECEIAQSSGAEGRIFARYWVHRRHILVDGRKMSKSLGNFHTVRDLLAKGFSGLEIRLALLSAHYRSTANFSFDGLVIARKTLRYLREFVANMAALAVGEDPTAGLEAVEKIHASHDQAFRKALDDDLNVSAALAAVHGFVGEVYRLPPGGLSHRAGLRAVVGLHAWDAVLGVLGRQDPAAEPPEEESAGPSDDEITALLAARDAARAGKDYAESDRIRDLLREAGIVVKDSPDGSRWHREI